MRRQQADQDQGRALAAAELKSTAAADARGGGISVMRSAEAAADTAPVPKMKEGREGDGVLRRQRAAASSVPSSSRAAPTSRPSSSGARLKREGLGLKGKV
eukprot:CAMPEP_0118854694 /NCGR_PEP_ID=MMETSP1163-20130328/2808_1 /TAXON_ID=124430 /ORGANISM="Phaeomonas parva, Strain CCMP2877" /LENGTH=100 /DNA_ID=CAMNT_0006787457 /DNA_START=359 /DNA_END=661 /DNA_ORIENTATION=-